MKCTTPCGKIDALALNGLVASQRYRLRPRLFDLLSTEILLWQSPILEVQY